MKKTNRTSPSFGETLRAIGERFCGLHRMRRRMPKVELSRNVNDRWLAQSDDLSWQQYGDGGDCWWPGQ